jgi:hypothetical protein
MGIMDYLKLYADDGGLDEDIISNKRLFNQPGFSNQNPNAKPKQAFLYGFLAVTFCVAVWLALIGLSFVEANFLAITIGIITGFAIRLGGKSTCKLFGTIAIVLTLCGSMAGLVGSRFIIMPHNLHISLSDLIDKFGLLALARISLERLELIDFIYLILAVLVAYLITNPIRIGEISKLH